MLDFKMIENHLRSKPLCFDYTLAPKNEQNTYPHRQISAGSNYERPLLRIRAYSGCQRRWWSQPGMVCTSGMQGVWNRSRSDCDRDLKNPLSGPPIRSFSNGARGVIAVPRCFFPSYLFRAQYSILPMMSSTFRQCSVKWFGCSVRVDRSLSG